MPIYYPVHGPSAMPADVVLPTSELLRLPYALSQTGLLSSRQFMSEAKLRGLRLDREELELLHRRGVLVPFFRVHARPVSAGESLLPEHQAAGVAWQVYRAAKSGHLSDPASRPFAPWPKRSYSAEVYYSTYQLLSLRALPLWLSRMDFRTTDDGVRVRQLRHSRSHERIWSVQDRNLAIVLEALSARYRPRVMQSVRSPTDDLQQFISSDDPNPESTYLGGLEGDAIANQAENLLRNAETFDPLGKWSRVVRIGAPGRWRDLRNDALVAQDMRIAAEILLRFHDDQVKRGRASRAPYTPAARAESHPERLRVTSSQRSETVLDFQLSDRSAIFLALEGQTEVSIATQLLQLAGYEPYSTWVTLVDLEGINRDFGLLARSVGVPRVDPDGHVGARITAPLSALIVATDPEGPHRTERQREASRSRMIDDVIKSLPPALRTQGMRKDIEHLVHVRTWPAEFEFAHFSNSAIARAIRVLVPGCPPISELKEQLATCRAQVRSIRTVWKDWPIRPSKVALVEQLWPDLLRRVNNPKYRKALPIVDLLEEALHIAQRIRQARELTVSQ